MQVCVLAVEYSSNQKFNFNLFIAIAYSEIDDLKWT